MKVKLTIILITTGIIIWLILAFFIFKSRYKSAAPYLSHYSANDYEDQEELLFRQAKFKLTLILVYDDMVLAYYGDSLRDTKIVSINETPKLIEESWKKFPKESLSVFIKQTKEANINAFGKLLEKMRSNQVENVLAIRLNKFEKEILKIEK